MSGLFVCIVLDLRHGFGDGGAKDNIGFLDIYREPSMNIILKNSDRFRMVLQLDGPGGLPSHNPFIE